MKIGIVADEIDRDFRRAVRAGTSLGLRCYEVRHLKTGRVPLCDVNELIEVGCIANGEGVQITALSPGLFKYVSDGAGFAREMQEIYPRAAEWAHRWNLGGLIVFGFQKPGATEMNGDLVSSSNPPAEVTGWLAEAGERAFSDGLRLMIEPEPVCWADTWAATAGLIRQAGGTSLAVNYDPGNVAWVSREDSLDQFDQLAALILNVHVKDLRPCARGSGKPEFVPIGDGMIDYQAHCAALQRIGYSGVVSLEPHLDGSIETIRKCKEAFERLWAAALGTRV